MKCLPVNAVDGNLYMMAARVAVNNKNIGEALIGDNIFLCQTFPYAIGMREPVAGHDLDAYDFAFIHAGTPLFGKARPRSKTHRVQPIGNVTCLG